MRFAQSRGDGRVEVPRPVWVDRLRAAPRWHAAGENQVLDGDGHAVERPRWSAAVPARFRRTRRCKRGVGIDVHERVQTGGVPVDLAKTSTRHLDGRKRLLAKAFEKLDGGEESEFMHRESDREPDVTCGG